MPEPIRPDFLKNAELNKDHFSKKKRSPVSSVVILIVVVIGASAGGYFLHKKFRTPNVGADAPVPAAGAEPAVIQDITPPAGFTSAPATVAERPGSLAPAGGSAIASPATTTSTPDLTGLSLPGDGAATASSASSSTAISPTAATSTATSAGGASSPVVVPGTASTPISDGGDRATTPAAEPVVAGTPAELMKAADQKLAARDYAGAKRLLQTVSPGNAQVHAAALYRLGLVGRYSKDEKLAQDSWARAYLTYPQTLAGRTSALALADTMYYWYVEKTQDFAQWEKIRDAYAVALGYDGARFLDEATDKRVGERLNKLSSKLVFDPKMKIQGAELHTVQSGENPTIIAREYGVNFTSIVAINQIDPNRLQVGQVLKVLPGKLRIVIDKKRFHLDAYMNGRFLKRYGCATGAAESETPAGNYVIKAMAIEPDWTDPKTHQTYKYGDPGHLIGSRWLAMQGMGTNGLGIHGTVDPDSIGKKASSGCIRLLNRDVEELYGFASTQPGLVTEVTVVE